jgi:hypothetical protein
MGTTHRLEIALAAGLLGVTAWACDRTGETTLVCMDLAPVASPMYPKDPNDPDGGPFRDVDQKPLENFDLRSTGGKVTIFTTDHAVQIDIEGLPPLRAGFSGPKWVGWLKFNEASLDSNYDSENPDYGTEAEEELPPPGNVYSFGAFVPDGTGAFALQAVDLPFGLGRATSALITMEPPLPDGSLPTKPSVYEILKAQLGVAKKQCAPAAGSMPEKPGGHVHGQ